MALLNKDMVLTVAGNNVLTLTAEAGKSLLVKDVLVFNAVTAYATFTVEKATVGYFRVGTTLGSHLCPQIGALVDAAIAFAPNLFPRKTILGYLWDRGIFTGYPVGEGQTFSVAGVAQAGSYQIVIYDEADAGDHKAEDPNGANSSEYLYMNYGDTGGVLATAGDFLYDNSLTPAEFPDFPFGAVVPAKKVIAIHGICASDFSPNANVAIAFILTTYLKLVRDRTVLFDRNRLGLPMFALQTIGVGAFDSVGVGVSVLGNYTDVDGRAPLMFDPPLTFDSGDELSVFLSTVIGAAGANLNAADQCIGLITKVRAA